MKSLAVTFGARTITFYPLALTQIRDMASEVEALRSAQSVEIMADRGRFDAMIKLFTASAQRGKPEVTEEDVGAVVDMENLQTIMGVLLGRRVRELDSQEASTAPTSPQIGGESSRPSSPAQAGPSASSGT